ncbi:hypothetical protein RclHR1_00960008 [Rhizophagus clarus]|uniref:Protein kinase domain-containing protein n=1 Tax=Rhizophagus clarus TaxID=94130 RepID=A0A2Z6S701_9GLOM|nr:hypothetical protein RclHR1_00960008 [Rhizophagus clarus]
MTTIRKKLIYAAIQEAFSEAEKNPNLNYDLINQQKLLNGIIFANKFLTTDEKTETIRIIAESYDYFKIIKDEDEKRICENCQSECLATSYCEICIRNYLKSHFSNWISDNDDIDNLIQKCQMETVAPTRIIEWILYNNLRNIKYLTEGGFSEIYTAKWIDGPYNKWNSKKQQLNKFGTIRVIFKKLENVENANRSWFEEAKSHLTISNKSSGVVKSFGLSIDPSDGNYMLVLQQVDIDLRRYLLQSHNKLTWKERINIICDIIKALYEIHKENAIHRDLHSGNILYLQSADLWCISDLGFFEPADKSLKSIYGNLPYIAPEVFNGKDYSFKCDIYSIAILMWEISSGILSFNEYEHNYDLAINIINGMRPKIVPDIPLEYKQLMEQCWDADPSNRPDISYLYIKIFKIRNLYNQNGSSKSNDELALHKNNINLYQFFQSNKSIRFKTNTNNYIVVLNNNSWESGNEKIDDFIQEIQSEVNDFNNTVFEWIPYDQFNEIKKISKNDLTKVYSAIWKMIHYIGINKTKNAEKYLKSLFGRKVLKIYGISQNPNTNDYILVYSNSINLVGWTSGNEKIDNFIQEMQLKMNKYEDNVFEWISYNQFNKIIEMSKNKSNKTYSAIWKDGPLHYNNQYSNYIRDSNKDVTLICLHNSQNSVSFLINEAAKYLTSIFGRKIFEVYGISQVPDTDDYILVHNNFINLANWTTWTSGSEKIDDFIQKMQLKINDYDDIVFEWIQYNQFDDIKEIGKGGFSTVYSAKWKDGPLVYNVNEKIYNRDSNKVIALKCLHNSQNVTSKVLDEVKEYSINRRSNILNVYGISQNPITREYIIALNYAKEGNFNSWINENYKYFNWQDKLSALLNIISGLKEVHQKI